ncbi:MAG: hypothetical protein WC389_10380 [Lutibacter sp.]|jgi:hypothetical protein
MTKKNYRNKTLNKTEIPIEFVQAGLITAGIKTEDTKRIIQDGDNVFCLTTPSGHEIYFDIEDSAHEYYRTEILGG